MPAETTQQLYPLISDLGLILMTAAVAVLLFKKIKQPLVLGYLIAGFLAGNHFDFFPSVKDMHSVEVWAQIGIIFLLFSLGLEFSFKKLMKVGGTASITAITQILLMCCLGYGAGRMLGWNAMDSIFLGVMVSVSSTTIILKTFDELGVKAKRFAGIVIGSLIVQDLVAIVMMVLLSTLAATNSFSGTDLLMSVAKLLFFLPLWFVTGIFFIPTLLKRSRNLLTDEMLLIISIALCLVMVILAAKAGFSPALGAFIMGSIIAETTQAEHIEHLVKPVKDLFGAVFFVSVGMLIEPDTLTEHLVPVALLTLLVIVFQPITSAFGALLSGQPLRQSVQTGMSLSQIGEFSFIIATLGTTLGVTSKFLYPIVVAVSAFTTFTTPFMVRMSTPMAEFLAARLPRKWLKRIERYSANAQSIKSVTNWQVVLRAYLVQVVLHSVVIIGGILLSRNFFLPLVKDLSFGHALAALVTLVALAPFFWALSLRRVAVAQVQQLMSERRYRGPLVMMILFRFVLALFYIGFLLDNFFSPEVAFLAFCACIITYSIFPKKLNKQYHRIETRFMNNLNAREIIRMKRQRSDLTPWEGHMSVFDISRESNIAGHTLEELQLREQIGVNIAFIRRGEVTVNIPARNERLFPGDEVCVIGTDEQVEEFKKYLERNDVHPPSDNSRSEIVLQQLEVVQPEFIGRSIRQSQIRELTKGLVVGLERGGNRLLNPDSHVILEKDDILWIVGDKQALNRMTKLENTNEH